MEEVDVYDSEFESADDCPFPFGMISRCARAFERGCCCMVTYTPLIFVYGLTSWATWGIVTISRDPGHSTWLGKWAGFVGILLYALLNVSYTTAVFTDPGSTTSHKKGYSSLPTQAPPPMTSFTVKSNGEFRFCKKCQARKPDRAHHCSTCRRCVLKMDHHCPWLATCIGLRNHKCFLLFLIYTTLLCGFTFAVTGSYAYTDVISASNLDPHSLKPVSYILLSVLSALIGLVVGVFCGWHIMLASRGQTTIECLEKTRYLSPISKSIHDSFLAGRGVPQPGYGQQLIDIHANALPGITRPEEGEERRSPTNSRTPSIQLQTLPPPSSHSSYEEMERYRSRKRYEEYQDEEDSKKLPNAFDVGWRENLRHLFGPSPWLWFLPVCNTIGDGYSWPANPNWAEARDRLRADRERQRAREEQAGWAFDGASRGNQGGQPVMSGPKTQSKADKILGRDPNLYADTNAFSPRRPNTNKKMVPRDVYNDDDLFETTDDDAEDGEGGGSELGRPPASKRLGLKRTTNGFVPVATSTLSGRKSPLMGTGRNKTTAGSLLAGSSRDKKDLKGATPEESKSLMGDGDVD